MMEFYISGICFRESTLRRVIANDPSSPQFSSAITQKTAKSKPPPEINDYEWDIKNHMCCLMVMVQQWQYHVWPLIGHQNGLHSTYSIHQLGVARNKESIRNWRVRQGNWILHCMACGQKKNKKNIRSPPLLQYTPARVKTNITYSIECVVLRFQIKYCSVFDIWLKTWSKAVS